MTKTHGESSSSVLAQTPTPNRLGHDRASASFPTTMWNVFTKPWPTLPAAALADKLRGLGFDGVELPVRPGFQITPERAAQELPGFVAEMKDHGMVTTSLAAELSEQSVHLCAEVAVPFLRVMAPVDETGYLASEDRLRQTLDVLVPVCQDTGVRIGIQHHHGRYVSNSAGLRALLAGYPATAVSAVWDAAHSALAGEQPATGLEQVFDHLGMVNLKNAYYDRGSSPDERPTWKPRFVSGAHGMANWDQVARTLQDLDFTGPICLTAQYSPGVGKLDDLVAGDLAYAKTVFARASEPSTPTVTQRSQTRT